MSKPKTSVGQIMQLMTVLRQGDSFFTESKPSTVTSYATTMDVKVSTSKILVIEDHLTDVPKAKYLTKVTIL